MENENSKKIKAINKVLKDYRMKMSNLRKKRDIVITNFLDKVKDKKISEIRDEIKKYRDYLLKRLVEMGDDGERIWQEIINYTEMMEQDLSFGTGLRYPKNLREAIKINGANQKNKN